MKRTALAFLAGSATLYGLLTFLMWPRDEKHEQRAPRLRAVS